MAIILQSKPAKRYGNTQFRYSLTYVVVTFAVLLFLNIYCSKSSQEIFCKSKESAMVERCLLASSAISETDVLNATTVSSVISQINSLKHANIAVTDRTGRIILVHNSVDAAIGTVTSFPEISTALTGYDVFTWKYHNGIIQSFAAAPIYSYGSLIGCVYMTEYDAEQGSLIQTLQRNILMITVILELAVILFSVIFSGTFSKRLRRFRSSMRIIRGGNYAHKVTMGGHDELTLLGDEFNALTARLQASEDRRRQFVSDASHELKTPLASIKLLSDSILQNDMDMATVKEFVGDIGNEADRLNRMSMKLLSLSRIESQADGDCEIVPMAPTIERVSRMLSIIAEKDNISIIHEFRDDCPILILEDDLYQITFNLVENGIKYNTPGGTLTISVHREDDNAILRVSDTGVGIPEESLPHIFERFYRVDKARSRKSGGSGLGLAIVRSIVERNSGTITVESTPKIGTTFTVVFPIFDIDGESR